MRSPLTVAFCLEVAVVAFWWRLDVAGEYWEWIHQCVAAFGFGLGKWAVWYVARMAEELP